jgi:hypothetical protein
MQNLVVLLGGYAFGLGVVAIMVRRKEILDRFRPHRRGPMDPTWLAGWVGLVAVGGLIIAAGAAAHAPEQSTNNGVLIAGTVIAALGVVGVFGCFALAVIRWGEDQRTPFVVTHKPDCSECREVLPNPTISSVEGIQVRLHVENKSRVGVQRVRAYMRMIEAGKGPTRSHFLHIQHDNDPLRQLSRQGEYLPVRQPVHFDIAVVWRNVAAVPGTHTIRFEYADMSISDSSGTTLNDNELPIKWRLAFQVSGWTDYRDVAPEDALYDLTVASGGYPSLERVPNSGSDSPIS